MGMALSAYLSFGRSSRGVSPVVGVVLMIAVTVMLAAAISSFALGFGGQPISPPQVDWEVSYDGEDTVTIAHGGGEPIDASTVRIGGSVDRSETRLSDLSTGVWTVGDAEPLTVNVSETGDSIMLIWTASSGEEMILVERRLVPHD